MLTSIWQLGCCRRNVLQSQERRAKISAESWGRQRTIEERCCREGQIVFVGPGDETSSYQRRADMLKWGKDAWSSWECTAANFHWSSVSLCQDWMCFGVWRSSCLWRLQTYSAILLLNHCTGPLKKDGPITRWENEKSPPFCELRCASKKKGGGSMFFTPYQKYSGPWCQKIFKAMIGLGVFSQS